MVKHICCDYNARILFVAVEKIPCEEKDDKDISKLVSGIVKCSINRQISYKTVGPNEVYFFLLSFFLCVRVLLKEKRMPFCVYLKQNGGFQLLIR